MSAIGTKRTSPSALHMSAFDPNRTLRRNFTKLPVAFALFYLFPVFQTHLTVSSHSLPSGLSGKMTIQETLDLPVPGERFELPTNGLQNRCSTTELTRLSPENTHILLFRKRTKTKLPPDCHRNWAKNERPPKMLGAGFVLRASPSWRVPV